MLPITPLVTRYTMNNKKGTYRQKPHFKDAVILLVEDNPVNKMVATEMLTALGFAVTPAGNGLEALEMFSERKFDLIFMDCQMPEMDGFEATKQIRIREQKLSLDRSPIVAFTANAMKGDEECCFNSGMDDFMTKPISNEVIKSMLLKWVPEKCVSADAPAALPVIGGPEVDSVVDTEVTHADDSNDIVLVDLVSFNKMKELFKSEFPGLINLNQSIANGNIEKSFSAVKNRDSQALCLAMHSLKGSSRQYGAMRLGYIAEQLETCARKKSFEGVDALLEQLKIVGQETYELIDKQMRC
jgi:CheY-like chemotaxis protein/HPt (histidine-containing phosphotransfer) domain-containing protein